MPTQLYRRIRRERLVTYALWAAMVGLLAWGVVAWVGYLSERAEVAERRAAQAERQADHMAELLAESERTQDHLARLVASLEEQQERTRAQRQRFRQDVNAILERLGIEVREQAESSGGPPTGREQSSSVTLSGEDGRVVRRTVRIPSGELDLSPDPPRESAGQPNETPQRDPPAPEPPKPKPEPKPEPQPAVRPTKPSQATGPSEHGPPDHAQGQGKSKARASKQGPPSHAQGRDQPPSKSPSSPPGRSDAQGPPGHAKGRGKKQPP